ncbi:hypothetical protein ACS15_0700 [Ralstonia insidiosa]|uniref:Uncharacterized protein n=1 Tax=Ralstonia insidiosa TaxID=190721 RepID=A0AAC9BIP9_9RALS|nr:hypothetical protein ACS15_0700 [Ralstonia insidiosa]
MAQLQGFAPQAEAGKLQNGACECALQKKNLSGCPKQTRLSRHGVLRSINDTEPEETHEH